MKQHEISEAVIKKYQEDEKTMVLIFAQWCVNNDLNPVDLYKQAYPQQAKNPVLLEACAETVDKNEADEITDELLLHVLDLFGNHDLAFIVNEVNQKRGLDKTK